MKLILKNAKKTDLFVHLCKNLHQICDTMNFQFNEDYLYVQSMDSNHICMIELRLDSEWFDEYEVDDGDNQIISVNTNVLQLILKCKSTDQSMKFEYEGDPDTLQISYYGGATDDFDKEFDMPLLSLEQDMLNVPSDSQWETEFDMKSTSFQTLMHEMNLFADTVQLYCSEEEFKLSAHGDHGKYKVKCNIDDLESYSIDEDTVVNAGFSLQYFTLISSFAKLSKMLNVEASNNLPIKLSYYLGEDEESNETNFLKFYLAPKMSDDDF